MTQPKRPSPALDTPLVITRGEVFEMIDVARESGIASGKQIAYGDILDYAEKRLAAAEDALRTSPDSPLALAECMVLSHLVDFYTGAPETFTRQAHEHNEALAEVGMSLGLFPSTALDNVRRAQAKGTL